MSVSPRMALWREPPPCWICGLQLTALVLPFALILMVYVPMGWRLLLRPTNLREMGHWIIHQWATKWVSDAAVAFLVMLAASCRDDSVGRQLKAKTDIHGPWSLTCTSFGDPNCLKDNIYALDKRFNLRTHKFLFKKVCYQHLSNKFLTMWPL